MKTSPRAKAAMVDLGHIDQVQRDRPLRESAATAPGQAMQNSMLRIELEQWQGASPVRHLEAAKVFRSKWSNRHEASFRDAAFDELKAEIADAGGNVQPIKVRPLGGKPDNFEVIFGHRRHQACLDLGFPVLAMIGDVSDEQAFMEMDRENRNRKDLRPYEQGMMYANALDSGLFASLRKMAEALGVSHSSMSQAVRLARLPDHVISSFTNPLEIQFRWSDTLQQMVERNPDLVASNANRIKADGTILLAKEVFEALIHDPLSPVSSTSYKVNLTGPNNQSGEVVINSNNGSIEISLRKIPAARALEIENLIRDFLAQG